MMTSYEFPLSVRMKIGSLTDSSHLETQATNPTLRTTCYALNRGPHYVLPLHNFLGFLFMQMLRLLFHNFPLLIITTTMYFLNCIPGHPGYTAQDSVVEVGTVESLAWGNRRISSCDRFWLDMLIKNFWLILRGDDTIFVVLSACI